MMKANVLSSPRSTAVRPAISTRRRLLLCQLGFDGIDINMGCPSKSIAHGGAGAGLIRTPKLAQEIVRATQRGVQDWLNGATVRDCVDVPAALAEQVEARHRRLPVAFQQRRPVPVSVKTRIGYASSQVQGVDTATAGERTGRDHPPRAHVDAGLFR